MPRIKIPNTLSREYKQQLLKELENIGMSNLINYMFQKLLSVLSHEHLQNKEFLSRYLLLAAVLDQQADSESAKETVVRIYTSFGADFFLKPYNYLNKLYDVIKFATGLYKPKTRVLRMKNEALILLRIGGFLLAVYNIENKYGSMIGYFSQATTPRKLLELIQSDCLLSGLLYEKAARMYTGWISHPKLWINLSSGRWEPDEIPMPINGHVCKVLARTGFLKYVLVEDTRKFIVKAEDERENIEIEVNNTYPSGDRLMIDFGAFYIGLNYCDEIQPKCNICPIDKLCMKNTQLRAY